FDRFFTNGSCTKSKPPDRFFLSGGFFCSSFCFFALPPGLWGPFPLFTKPLRHCLFFYGDLTAVWFRPPDTPGYNDFGKRPGAAVLPGGPGQSWRKESKESQIVM